MALNFGLFAGNSNLTNISGVQFQQEAENTKSITYTHTGGGNYETAYTVPAGKILFIGKILFADMADVTGGVILKIGGIPVIKNTVTRNTTYEMEFSIPWLVLGSTIIELKTSNVGLAITILGWEA